MKKKQFEKLAEKLYSRGYKRYDQHWNREDFVIGKGFHKDDNVWEVDRSAYQILLSIYDYTFLISLPDEMRDHVGIEVHIDVSRTSDERVEMCMAWHDTESIEDIECAAESFYQWVCSHYKEPREEKQNEEE